MLLDSITDEKLFTAGELAQQKSLTTCTFKPLNVLVLCTGNSARSVMAEALFNSRAGNFFSAYSAGSHPSGRVNPFALEQIKSLDLNYLPASKSWDQFALSDSVNLDLVLTVCGNAAQEICPSFIGSPMRIHWGLPDPADVGGNDDNIRSAFSACFRVFEARIGRLVETMHNDPHTNIVELMQRLANYYPPIPEINESGFTALIE